MKRKKTEIIDDISNKKNKIRQAIEKEPFTPIKLNPNFDDVKVVSGENLVEELNEFEEVYFFEETVKSGGTGRDGGRYSSYERKRRERKTRDRHLQRAGCGA